MKRSFRSSEAMGDGWGEHLKTTFAIGVLLWSSAALADDGWFVGFDQSGGVLYSTVDHPNIALEEEVLFLANDLSVEAHFLFHNTSDKAIELQVAFPIDFNFAFEWADPATLSASPDALNLASILTPDPKKSFEPAKDSATLKPGKLPLSGKWSFENFQKRTAASPPQLSAPAITQDGKPVEIREVGASLRVVGDDKPAGASGTHHAVLRFDYLHRLSFAAGARTTVVVKYAPTVTTSFNTQTSEHSFTYVLGTGATWKGPIGALWVAMPEWLVPQLSAALKPTGHWGTHALYLARDWEPTAAEQIRIEWTTTRKFSSETPRPEFLFSEAFKTAGTGPAPQQLARPLGASSALKQTTKVTRTTPHGHWLEERQADFSAASLFDGAPETAWCEGAKGPGVGEWVEFEVTQPVATVEVVNGFQKVTTRRNLQSASFTENGRAKALALTRLDGTPVLVMALPDQPARQSIDVALAAGKYRVTIQEATPGRKYADTCVGELSFRPADAMLRAVMGAPRQSPAANVDRELDAPEER